MSDANPRDPNPFVAFRRYADAQFAHMFNSLAGPFRQGLPSHERDHVQDMWRQFEKSYERATSPMRTQTERDQAQWPRRAEMADPGSSPQDGSQASAGPFHPAQVARRHREKQQQGIFGKMLSALGKTTKEEESIRNLPHQINELREEEQHRAEEIGRRMDRCPGVQVMYREQEEQERAEEIGRRMDRCPGVQAMYREQEEQERAEEIGRRVDRCPGVQAMYREQEEQERTEEIRRRMDRCPGVRAMNEEQNLMNELARMDKGDRVPASPSTFLREGSRQATDERTTPYGMSWSWGPWGCEMGSRRSRLDSSSDAKDHNSPDIRVTEHTFGPWTLGPFNVDSLRLAASRPEDIRAEMVKAADGIEKKSVELAAEMERKRAELLLRMQESWKDIEAGRSPYTGTPEFTHTPSQAYAPTELMKRDGFRGHRNWRQAFEDLVAAENGEAMLGGTPWSSTEHESDDSWRARLQDRGLLRPEDEWQKAMLGLSRPQAQTSQEAPHSELEYYDRMVARQGDGSEAQVPSILSTVTTVKSTQNPDGSTSTRRTTKRRFADGRVEQEEIDEGTPEEPEIMRRAKRQGVEDAKRYRERMAEEIRGSMAEQLRQEERTGKWFWS